MEDGGEGRAGGPLDRCDATQFSEQDRNWLSQTSYLTDAETRPREVRGPHMKIQPPHALCLPCNYSLWLTKSYLLSLAPKAPPDPPNLTLQSQFSSCPTASTPVVHLVLLVLCGSSASINLLSFSPLHLRNFSIWIPLPSPPLRSLPGMPLGRLRSNLSSSPIVY